MWTGHFAAAFFMKALFPNNVSLGTLCLASALPDFVFYLHSIMWLNNWEKLHLANFSGVFPYAPYYPFTHSLLGMAILGVLFVGFYRFVKGLSPSSTRDAQAIFWTVMTHFLLELPGHRKDISILPGIGPFLGASLFNSTFYTFVLEAAVLFPSFVLYLAQSQPLHGRAELSRTWAKYLLGNLVFQHLFFCFGKIPIDDTRYVHPIMFNSLILLTMWLADELSATRIMKYDKLYRAQNVQEESKKVTSSPTTARFESAPTAIRSS